MGCKRGTTPRLIPGEPRSHSHPLPPWCRPSPSPRVPPVGIFLGSPPGRNVSPLPSKSGGRNCWNSDRLSNSANFILRNKGQCPRRRGLVWLPAARRPGLGSAGRARNAAAAGAPAPNSCPEAPRAVSSSHHKPLSCCLSAKSASLGAKKGLKKSNKRAGISLRDFQAASQPFPGLFPLQVYPQPIS